MLFQVTELEESLLVFMDCRFSVEVFIKNCEPEQ